ncbi:hypothetical protein JOB18_009776 [Solea senegalensis]|uniref:Uncharacterized protein n=1 Tax=Solea senegalensis TaxID=28829 RepID=A0AAV6SFP4_SOLSE|nr:hypothetical protein JOB18_009776 [Solea senegalensis]
MEAVSTAADEDVKESMTDRSYYVNCGRQHKETEKGYETIWSSGEAAVGAVQAFLVEHQSREAASTVCLLCRLTWRLLVLFALCGCARHVDGACCIRPQCMR